MIPEWSCLDVVMVDESFLLCSQDQLIYLCLCFNKQTTHDFLCLTKNKFMSQMLLLSFSRILHHLALLLSCPLPDSSFQYIYPVLQANDSGIILHVCLIVYIHYVARSCCSYPQLCMESDYFSSKPLHLACLSINLIASEPVSPVTA